MIKVGIVGLGFMAAAHIKAYRQVPAARIAALCNPSGRHFDGDFSKVAGNIDIGEPVRLNMDGVLTYRSLDEMLANPEIQLIDICAPTRAHPDLAIAALRAGKHVICEKPLARTSELARSIVEAAKGARGFFMPAMCVRFWPEFAWLKSVIDDQRYGRIFAARFRRVAEPPGWGQSHFPNGTLSGGALLDLHIHDTDFVQYCFGKPRRVYSTGYTKFSGAVDHVVTQYHVASEVIVHAEGSWAMSPGFGFNMSYTANFERATVDFDLARPAAERLRVFQAGQPAQNISFDLPDGYVQELAYLTDCITAGRPPKQVTAQDALDAVQVCEAEEESIRTGQVVALS